MKASPEEEGRIIAQSRFDVNEEMREKFLSTNRNDGWMPDDRVLIRVPMAPSSVLLASCYRSLRQLRPRALGLKHHERPQVISSGILWTRSTIRRAWTRNEYLYGALTLAQIWRYNQPSRQFRPEYYSMKVSLRFTYAIMAAVDMAMHTGSGPVQAKSIARRQSIPVRFLEQVLHAMKKGGLISSLRGAQGGYVLSRKPSDMSVADVLEALEGPALHTGMNGRSYPIIKSDALLAKIWDRVAEAEHRVLEGITIEELAGQQREIEQQRTLMYHI